MEDLDDSEFVASEHDRLISAVSKLDKTQHITEPTRNESTNQKSEFNLIKRSKKLDLNKVVNVLKDTSHHVQISKKLKKAQDESTVLPKPLEKPQAERIKRATGYEETKKKVGRWDPVVAHSRTVDYVSFPLKNVSSKPEPADEFISKFTLKSDLEKELDQIDPPVEKAAEDEDEQVYPMSYQEMVEHRQHLAKIRAQQSYKAAKAKRQSKIKSKKYHRILKKEKLKQQLKEFEDLQKENPEEALKKLDALEKARALERHTLRHKNTGKWAKNLMIRAKYDKDVRQQLAEQLAVSRNLTKKVQDTESTDDEAEENQNIPDLDLAQDPMNPWMLQRSNKSNVDADFDFGYKKYVKDRKLKRKDDSETDSNDQQDNEDNDVNETTENKLDFLKENIRKLDFHHNDSEQASRATATSNWLVEASVPVIQTATVEIPVVTQDTTDSNIETSKFVKVKPKYLNTALPDGENNLDQLDDEQVVPKVNIEEVFEEDDLVASFRQEKEDEVKKDQLDDIDLSLPGWGSWGGKGVKATKRKKNRFIIKAPPKVPRRDDNKGDIIIKEFKNPQLNSHKVTHVPFPFKSVKDYEASIRAPIGNTFIPEKAHKQLIRPNVITKAGTVIEPMDEDELLQPKNRRFKNMDIIKLLSKQ